MHQGDNFWIINHLPWWSFGVTQCVCVNIREGGIGDANVYPIQVSSMMAVMLWQAECHIVIYFQYNWVDNLIYMGRELIGVEYINEDLELDHWAYGPHHVWVYPEDGRIVRMYQPFNGLQIYPAGVSECSRQIIHLCNELSLRRSPGICSLTITHVSVFVWWGKQTLHFLTDQGPIDSEVFANMPPQECTADGALFRIGCDDDGYPLPEKVKKVTSSSDRFSQWPSSFA